MKEILAILDPQALRDKPEGSGDDLGVHLEKLVEKATDKVISTSWLGQVMMKVRDQN